MDRPPNDDQQPPVARPEASGLEENAPATPSGPAEQKRAGPLLPDVLEPGQEEYERRQGSFPFGGSGNLGGPFGPRSFGGGRVQVYGCSPGCLIVSLVVSVVLSVVLTLLLNLIF